MGNVRARVFRIPAEPIPAAAHPASAFAVERDRFLAGDADFFVLRATEAFSGGSAQPLAFSPALSPSKTTSFLDPPPARCCRRSTSLQPTTEIAPGCCLRRNWWSANYPPRGDDDDLGRFAGHPVEALSRPSARRRGFRIATPFPGRLNAWDSELLLCMGPETFWLKVLKSDWAWVRFPACKSCPSC